MKKLSFWAKGHKRASRFLIVLSFILLNVAGIITGVLLDDLNVIVPLFVFYSIILIYFIGIICYPLKANKKKLSSKIFYKRQKICDFILAASAFGLVVCISNGNTPGIRFFNGLHASTPIAVPFSDNVEKTYKSINSFSASLKDANGKNLSWKARKKLLKEQVKEIKKANDMSTGGKIVLIILSSLIAAGLLYGLAALACTLSCNGSEAAALLVGIGGTALIVFLLVIAIRAITGKKKRN